MIQIDGRKIYTVDESTKILNVSYQTVRTYIKTGLLKAQKIGRRWYIPEDSIKKLAFGNDSAASVVSESTDG